MNIMNAPSNAAPAIKLLRGYTLMKEKDKQVPNLAKKYTTINFLKCPLSEKSNTSLKPK